MVRIIDIRLTCDELCDIYMALNIVVDILGKRDLVEIRDKIVRILSEKCKVKVAE